MGSPRILVLRGGAIGDFVVTLPVLDALRAQWPGAHIELACYPRVAPLALLPGLAQNAVSLDRPEFARLFRLRGDPEEQDRRWFTTFDLVLSFLYDPDGLVRRALEACPVRQLLDCDPRPVQRHAADHLATILESLAIFATPAVPSLAWPRERTSQARALLGEHGVTGRPFALHPGSGGKAKNWPPDRFLEFAGRLRTAGWSPFFLIGEAEEDIASLFTAAATPFPCLRPAGLESVADLLSASRAYAGNDSGISHLAAALALDSLVLFGPTRAEEWAPRGRGRVQVLRKGPRMDHLEVDDVLRSAHMLGWI